MLGQGRKEKGGSAAANTIIGQQSRVEGDIYFSGSLHIDGNIRGSVIAEEGSSSILTVSEHGCIEGNVQVAAVILNGTVNGDIRSGERIELAPKAKVNGDVYYHLIEMAMGAEVNGSLIHGEQSPSSVLAFGRDVVAGTSETQE